MKLSSKSFASALIAVTLAASCGDSGSTGSGGATSSATVTAAQTATGVGVTGSSSTGSPYVCGMGGAADEATCMTTSFSPDCGPCLAQACCATTIAAQGNATDDDVIKCAKACCKTECYPAGVSDYPFECSPPATSPSNGSCVAISGTIMCNPLTNEGCNSAAGEACDRKVDTNTGANIGFQCYPALNDMGDMQNINSVCDACNDGLGYCKPGLSCFDQCGKYCCADSDCSPGTCQHTDTMAGPLFPFAPGVGLCTM